MKIKCNRAALHDAVQLAASIVPVRTPKPILQCIKLETRVHDKTAVVMATDNELIIEYSITQVQIEDEGNMVVPADRLAGILHESSDETIDLELTDATCQVTGKDSRFLIYGHDPGDYPVLESPAKQADIEMKASALQRMVHMTVFSAARENTRYAINGVLWEQRAKKLRMVATDGRRLAKIDGLVENTRADGEQNTIVPVKSLQILERTLHSAEGKAEIRFLDNQISFWTPVVQITSNLIQGRFPKYEDVIPGNCTCKAQMQTELLASAVRQAALLTNEQSRGILMSFSQGVVHLSSSTPEAGEAKVKMPATYEGKDLGIGFNPHYLLDALRVIDEPKVTMEMVDAETPGVLRAGKDFLYVLMPVAV